MVLVLVNIMLVEMYIHNVFVFKDIPELIVKVIEWNKKHCVMRSFFIQSLATLCSATSCNGGVCYSSSKYFCLFMSNRKSRWSLSSKIAHYFPNYYNGLFSMPTFVWIIHVPQRNNVNKQEININVCWIIHLNKTWVMFF